MARGYPSGLRVAGRRGAAACCGHADADDGRHAAGIRHGPSSHACVGAVVQYGRCRGAVRASHARGVAVRPSRGGRHPVRRRPARRRRGVRRCGSGCRSVRRSRAVAAARANGRERCVPSGHFAPWRRIRRELCDGAAVCGPPVRCGCHRVRRDRWRRLLGHAVAGVHNRFCRQEGGRRAGGADHSCGRSPNAAAQDPRGADDCTCAGDDGHSRRCSGGSQPWASAGAAHDP
mmetsp:Transcript_3795/g.14082  ORF Transcript_3795/g.14082 Transcript_3795/m.14082 type:complete len:232 (-) Transcript_3795:286-981(-)